MAEQSLHPDTVDALAEALAGAPTDERIARIERIYDYKYFGDYEMSDDQRAAVDDMMLAVLAVQRARAALKGMAK